MRYKRKCHALFLVMSSLISYCVFSQTQLTRPTVNFSQGLQGKIQYIGLSNDPENLVFTINGPTVAFMRTSDLREVNQYTMSGRLTTGKFSSSGHFLLSTVGLRGTRNKGLQVRALLNGKILDTVIVNPTDKYFVSKDEQYLIVFNDHIIQLFDIKNLHTDPKVISIKELFVMDVVLVTRDSQAYVVALLSPATSNRILSVMDLSGAEFFNSTAEYRRLSFVSNDSVYVTEGDQSVRCLDLSKGVKNITLRPAVKVGFAFNSSGTFSGDGKYWVSRGTNGFAYVYDLRRKIFKDSLLVKASSFGYDSRTEKIFFVDTVKKHGYSFETISAYSLVQKTKTTGELSAFSPIIDVASSRDRNFIAFLTDNFNLEVCDLKKRLTYLYNFMFDKETDSLRLINRISFTPDSKYLFFSSSNNLGVIKLGDSGRPKNLIFESPIFEIIPARSGSSMYAVTGGVLYKVNAADTSRQLLFRNKFVFDPYIFGDLGVINDSVIVLNASYYYNSKNELLPKSEMLRRGIAAASKNWINKNVLYFINTRTGDTLSRFDIAVDLITRVVHDTTSKLILFYTTATKFTIDEKSYQLLKKESLLDNSSGLNLNRRILTIKNAGLAAIKNDVLEKLENYNFLSASSVAKANYQVLNFVQFDDVYSFLLLSDGVIHIVDNAGFSEVANVASYQSANPEFANDWLTVSNHGYFDGNSNVVSFFYWQDSINSTYYSYDAFYSTFFTPNLLLKVLNHSLKDTTLDLSYYVRIPGLSEMIRNNTASIKVEKENKYLCFAPSAKNISTYLVNNFGTAVRFDDQSKDCSVSIPLPRDVAPAYNGVSKQNSNTGTADPYYFENKVKGNFYLVDFGIGRYSSSSNLPELPFSLSSVDNIENAFKNDSNALKNEFDSLKIFTHKNEAATLGEIYNQLNRLAKIVKPSDCVFVYFNGHGVIPENSEVFYFYPYDGINNSTAGEIQSSCLSVAAISDIIRFIDANRIIIVIDACESGGSIDCLKKICEMKMDGGNAHISLNVVAATLPLAKANQLTGGSLLSQWIVEALKRPEDGKHDLNLRDFFARVKQYAGIPNKEGISQTPMFMQTGADFPIFRQ